MQFRVDSLGLSGGVTQVLRDLIHQRLGLFYDANQFDQLADRLAPLVAFQERVPETDRPDLHIRQVHPGDHRRKLLDTDR